MPIRLFVFVTIMVSSLAAACGDGASRSETVPTTTPRPLPAPVEFGPEPLGGATRGDPSFEALPDAQAYFGELGGSIYQIEMPDEWNGRLVLYLHGFANFAPTLSVDAPTIRSYLIRNGYAWGASSYSSNSLVPGLAADETAALWDLFAREFGRPRYTYVTGHSMGGGGVHIAAERYGDRFDGGLALCGVAGNTSQIAYLGDMYVAAAYLGGVARNEFSNEDAVQLLNERILPALEDPVLRDGLIDILIDLSGGPRPFARKGIESQLSGNFQFAGTAVGAGLFDNRETIYSFDQQSDVSEADFNATALRVEPGVLAEAFYSGQDTTGEIALPLLSVHTTGDMFVPMTEQQILRRQAEAADAADLLVQRTVQSDGHCTFIDAEWEQQLEDLVAWVERGEKPAGEDVLADDLSEIGAAYTYAPRLDSPEADAVPGAEKRLSLSGTATIEGDIAGEPMRGVIAGVVVRNEGLEAACVFDRWTSLSEGAYSVTVASAEEVRGCGEPGVEIYLFAFSAGQVLTSQELGVWPNGTELVFDATFSREDTEGAGRPVTTLTGGVRDSSGARLPIGTQIEARIGDALCGVTALPPVVMGSSNPASYFLIVSGPDAIPGCEQDDEITILIDGRPAQQTATNDFQDEPHELDLTLP